MYGMSSVVIVLTMCIDSRGSSLLVVVVLAGTASGRL